MTVLRKEQSDQSRLQYDPKMDQMDFRPASESTGYITTALLWIFRNACCFPEIKQNADLLEVQ